MSPAMMGRMVGRRLSWWVVVAMVFGGFSLAGAPAGFGITVKAKDRTGHVATSYRGTVAFTSSDPGRPELPATYTFTSADRGVHAFARVALHAMGTRTITVTDTRTASITGASAPIRVSPGTVRLLAVSAPTTATGGVGFNLTVSAQDAWANSVVSYRGAVAFTATDAAAALPATYRFTRADMGTRTFTGVVLETAGSQRVAATDVARPAVTGSAAVQVRPAVTEYSLYAWGAGHSGQLGDGHTIDRLWPVRVGTDTRWASLSAGYDHTVAVKSDGTLWAWGDNFDGQLGDGTTTTRPAPVRVGTDTHWAAVAAGAEHSVALETDGTLWAWGDNENGQLGDGTTTNQSEPVGVGTDTHWAAVAAGQWRTVAIKTDGTLWAWGWNSVGQLGDGTTTNRSAPVQVGTDTHWASVDAGLGHTVAIKTDGTLWAWGVNVHGQLGDGTTISRSAPVRVGTGTHWVRLAVGYDHSVAIKTDGTLWAWGDNGSSQLGDGEDFTVALTSGTVQRRGRSSRARCCRTWTPSRGTSR